MNEFEEEFEFDDDVTDDEVREAFEEWVWNQVGNHYSWYEKE